MPKNPIEAYKKSMKEWIQFWRANPHRFAQDYLQLRLKPFQQVMLYMFNKNKTNILIATRGIGKSFMTAVYACCMAILYPNSKIVVVCKTTYQSKLFISQKIENELYQMSVMLRREIKEIRSESEQKVVHFKNGSTITAVNAAENRRGLRATILIVDEAVKIEQSILESVCLPFLNGAVRQRGYKKKPEYASYVEKENQTIYLTSAWFKNHYFYKEYYLRSIKEMLNKESSFVLCFDEKMPLMENLTTESEIADLKKKLNPMRYDMEMRSIFWGEDIDAFFKVDLFNKCRTGVDVYYPPSNLDYVSDARSKYEIAKKDGEARVLSADIAVAAGRKNDNSIYSLMRVLPISGSGFRTHLAHMESHNGLKPEKQALQIKRLFYDFKCDRAVIDAHGVGISVYNELKKETYDPERNERYPEWGAYNEDSMVPGTVVNDVHYVLYAMKASADSNHEMAMHLNGDIMSEKIVFPMSETEAEEILQERYGYSSLIGSMQAKLLEPFIQTTLLMGEMVNLKGEWPNGKIKLKEKAGARKDRYSSLAYGNFICHQIIEERTKKVTKSKFMFFT
ncbi:terminase large subunit domain-containing protein [Peptostreptococcus faecalis]|uniref:terminase large subunit domain-containing protein n=1 Tax=Peptostreptococcus faecalis TaxID=2045015 RepID=UPI000C7CE486|nr:terminase family protein [Peptostreptococcus faecalis]